MDLLLKNKIWIELTGVLLLFVIAVLIVLNNFVLRLPIASTRNYQERELGPALLGDTQVTDCFTTNDFAPAIIEWQFADYGRKNTNTITADFYLAKNPETTLTKFLSAKDIQENFFTGVAIPEPMRVKDKEICFKLYSTDATDSNTESIFIDKESGRPIYRLYPSAFDSLFGGHLWGVLKKIITSNY